MVTNKATNKLQTKQLTDQLKPIENLTNYPIIHLPNHSSNWPLID